MSSDKKLLIELVVVLVLVGFGLWSLNKDSSPFAKSDEVVVIDTTTGGAKTNSPATASISYQNALVQYKDARIQLDSACQASPKNATFKNGTNIMIDNRSDKSRTVKVGSTFIVNPWGFRIIKLSSSTLPATWYVDCGTSQNVATILIQK